jgi:alginate O-acetyltransferase complex protein AlgI
MLFNSWQFVAFMATVLAVVIWLPRNGTAWKVFMVLVSCYFYGQWSYAYLSLIFVTATVDFVVAQRLAHTVNAKRLVIISIVANLSVLGFFKYANFAINSVNGVVDWAGFVTVLSPLDIVLPVGISFYTFQNMSYTIDVYRGHLVARRSWLDYATFTTFFPQLLAGPIVRATEFFGQLDKPEPMVWRDIQFGLVLILAGYVKKVVLADNLAVTVDATFGNVHSAGGWQSLLAVYAFAFQIYFDFSGYTDIAIGLALLLGFKFPKNFDYPYLATSFQEFWRRWHMTLSRWLRDFLYISLGGNRAGQARTLANLFTTMVLGGLWHGASWNFVIWGALHGGYLAVERLILSHVPGWSSSHWAARAVRAVIVFHFVCLAWIFFRAPDLGVSMAMLRNIGQIAHEPLVLASHGPLLAMLSILAVGHWAMSLGRVKERLADTGPFVFSVFAAACVLMLIWFAPAKSAPFIYFQF